MAWDPKITTFPGLYIVSASVHEVVQPLLNTFGILFDLCSPQGLRLINITAAIAILFLLLKIDPSVHHVSNSMPASALTPDSLSKLTLFLYPISFFYYFFYYTDTCSTLSLVAMQYLVNSGTTQPSYLRQLGFVMV